MPQKAVAHAATAQEYLGRQLPFGQPAFQGARHSAGNQVSRRAQEIMEMPALLLGLLNRLECKFIAESLPGQALGRALQKVGVTDPALQESIQTPPLHGV